MAPLDNSVLKYSKMLRLAGAETQHQQNVKNWMDGNRPIVRSEAGWVSCLLESEDFVALNPIESSKAGLENLLDRILKRWPRFLAKVYNFPCQYE